MVARVAATAGARAVRRRAGRRAAHFGGDRGDLVGERAGVGVRVAVEEGVAVAVGAVRVAVAVVVAAVVAHLGGHDALAEPRGDELREQRGALGVHDGAADRRHALLVAAGHALVEHGRLRAVAVDDARALDAEASVLGHGVAHAEVGDAVVEVHVASRAGPPSWWHGAQFVWR